MQSTALAVRLRRTASRRIAHPPGASRYDGAPAASSAVQPGLQIEDSWRQCLTRYIKGWAHADPAMIAGATVDGYRFHDPLVGSFTAQRLSRYFDFLHARFACDGVPAQPTFHLHGPMDRCVRGEFAFFRE